MIKAVVFDMDGVLCHYRIERRLARLASWSRQDPDAIHAAIWRSGFEDEAERGIVSADDYLKGFGERIGYALSAAQWVEARRVAIEPDLAILSLARQLSTDRPVGMFTNNPFLLKRHIAEVFPAVPQIFGTRAVFSAELGRSKPDPGGLPPPGRPSHVCARGDPLLRRRCNLCGRCPRGRTFGGSSRRSGRRTCQSRRARPRVPVAARALSFRLERTSVTGAGRR